MRSPGGKDKNRTYNSNYIPKEAEYLGGGWVNTLAGEESDPRPKICDNDRPVFDTAQTSCKSRPENMLDFLYLSRYLFLFSISLSLSVSLSLSLSLSLSSPQSHCRMTKRVVHNVWNHELVTKPVSIQPTLQDITIHACIDMYMKWSIMAIVLVRVRSPPNLASCIMCGPMSSVNPATNLTLVCLVTVFGSPSQAVLGLLFCPGLAVVGRTNQILSGH